MTIKLLTPRDLTIGGRYLTVPAGSIVTLDSATETGLIASKEATSNLSEGTTFSPPVLSAQPVPVMATPSAEGPRTQVLGIDTGISLILPASVLAAPVAVTGVTTEQVLHSFVVPKECHGTKTRLIFAFMASMTNNANVKTIRLKIGSNVGSATVIALSAPANVNQLSVLGLRLRNRGSKAVQVSGYSLSLNSGTSSTPPSTFAIDFAADQTVFVTAQLANAADTVTLEDFEMAFGG